MMENKTYKTVADSSCEFHKCIHYEDINGGGRLFGGRLMMWMDEIAGVAAMRHCGGLVTTAAVDNLQFKKGAGVDDIIVITAHLTYVGRTSMEVRVDVYVEERATGRRIPINRAYFTEVCVDREGVPQPVIYGLTVKTPGEQAEWDGAEKRIEMRKRRRIEGF